MRSEFLKEVAKGPWQRHACWRVAKSSCFLVVFYLPPTSGNSHEWRNVSAASANGRPSRSCRAPQMVSNKHGPCKLAGAIGRECGNTQALVPLQETTSWIVYEGPSLIPCLSLQQLCSKLPLRTCAVDVSKRDPSSGFLVSFQFSFAGRAARFADPELGGRKEIRATYGSRAPQRAS